MREQVIGLRWTPEAIAAYEAALTALAVARKEFAEYARRHTGRAAVELFTSTSSNQACVRELAAGSLRSRRRRLPRPKHHDLVSGWCRPPARLLSRTPGSA